MRFVPGPLDSAAGPAMEMALTHALLRQASRAVIGPTVRIYRPSGRVVAFGRRDTLRPGFADAVKACRVAGFVPAVRPSGGRAVAYTPSALVIDLIEPDQSSVAGIGRRFREYGAMYAAVLRALGIDARVGEVPGEYCPGEYSVNARGQAKIIGTAQRLVRGAWLFGAVVIVNDAALLRSLYQDVYPDLELTFDPASVGSVRDEAPQLGLDDVERAFLEAFAARTALERAEIPTDALAEAHAMLARHRVDA